MPWLIQAHSKSHSDLNSSSRTWTTALNHPYYSPRVPNTLQNQHPFFHNQQSLDLAQGSRLTLGSLSSTNISMLDVPEILERILTYLTLQDRLSSRLVCKQWYAASRSLVRIQTVWQENPVPVDQYHVLRGLAGLDSLTYTLKQMDYDATPNVQIAWSRLKERVSTGQTASLQTLTVNGPVNIQVRIAPLLPHMTSLTMLRLHSVCSSSYTIAMVLDKCPQLKTLDIHSESSLRPRQVKVLEAGELQGPYKLETLCLFMACITQSSVEATVANCPALKSLSLIDLIDPPLIVAQSNASAMTTSTSTAVTTQINKRQLIATIGESCPNLSHFHCSTNQGQRDMVSPMSLFAHLNSLGLPAQTFCLELVNIIQSYTSVLTSLTLVGVSNNNAELSESLHRYLCTARHLKQLDAPFVQMDDRLLNLSAAVPPTSAITPTNPAPALTSDKIWACRDLISLNISFDNQEHGTRNLAESSRILFGYLSRVCPRLQHLKICRNTIDCSLDGGLCLLSELEDLQTLEIKTVTLTVLNLWDFGWMHNEPTVLQRLADKMSLNESRLQKSFRSRYEWLGCKDSRHIDLQRLELLGLIELQTPLPSSSSPFPASSLSSSPLSATSSQPNHHHRRTLSNDSRPSNTSSRQTAHRSRSHSYSGRFELTGNNNNSVRWPRLERFTIHQMNDRRNQARNIHGYIKKMRPDLSCDF